MAGKQYVPTATKSKSHIQGAWRSFVSSTASWIKWRLKENLTTFWLDTLKRDMAMMHLGQMEPNLALCDSNSSLTLLVQKKCCFLLLFSCSVMSDSLWPPWTAARQASLSFSISQSLLKVMPIESMMPSNHLIRCCPLLLLPSIFPSIRVFSNELALCIRWPNYWSFSFSIDPSNQHSGLISFRIG